METGADVGSAGLIKCPKCGGDAVSEKPFCPNCGALLALGLSGASIDSYVQDRIKEQLDGSFKDKRLVELETTEAIVTRLVNWAKVFAFAVGIPLAVCAAVLALLGYNSIQDARRLTSEAAAKIRPVVDDAMVKAGEAQEQSRDALKRVGKMRESLKVTETAVQDQNSKAVEAAKAIQSQLTQASGMKIELAGLASQLEERTRETAKLQKTVNELSRRVETSEVAKVFPDLGSKPVATINGQVLGTKPAGQLWVDLQLSYRAERDTRLTADQINELLLALKKEGVTVFLGYPGVTRNRGTQMAIQPGGSEERTEILYFRPDQATAAKRVRKVIERWVPVQDAMVRLREPATLDETTLEFLRLSGLDLLVAIGTR